MRRRDPNLVRVRRRGHDLESAPQRRPDFRSRYVTKVGVPCEFPHGSTPGVDPQSLIERLSVHGTLRPWKDRDGIVYFVASPAFPCDVLGVLVAITCRRSRRRRPTPLPADPAISEAATACQGRRRDGCVPFPSLDQPQPDLPIRQTSFIRKITERSISKSRPLGDIGGVSFPGLDGRGRARNRVGDASPPSSVPRKGRSPRRLWIRPSLGRGVERVRNRPRDPRSRRRRACAPVAFRA